MNASIQALLAHIVDYAGLFPPAKLDMAPVVSNYARYASGPHAWMLGRLIIPTARFDEFAGVFEQTKPNVMQPWQISALGGGGDNAAQFADRIARDVKAIAELQKRIGRSIAVDAYETRLPVGVISGGDGSAICELACDAATRFGSSGLAISSAAFEIGFAEDWQGALPVAIEALADAQRTINDNGLTLTIAAKIRTGGVEAHMFPDSEKVATFISTCRKHRVPFKATAGLHHPVRHLDDTVQTRMHGFINVFAAAVLAFAQDVRDDDLLRMIECESAGPFVFDDDAMAWSQYRADVSVIKSARTAAALGFGSCSFQEPVEDLIHLGWL